MPSRDDLSGDSLERIELEFALEEVIDSINADTSLSSQQRERLIRQVQDRFELGLWDEDGCNDEDDWNDDTLGVLIQRLGPKGPKGKSGSAAAHPEPESYRFG